jgi:hypothetical protein
MALEVSAWFHAPQLGTRRLAYLASCVMILAMFVMELHHRTAHRVRVATIITEGFAGIFVLREHTPTHSPSPASLVQVLAVTASIILPVAALLVFLESIFLISRVILSVRTE